MATFCDHFAGNFSVELPAVTVIANGGHLLTWYSKQSNESNGTHYIVVWEAGPTAE